MGILIKSGNLEVGILTQGEPHAKMKTRDCRMLQKPRDARAGQQIAGS